MVIEIKISSALISWVHPTFHKISSTGPDVSKKSLKISKMPEGGNQNPQIEEGQTTQWPNEKGQNDKQQFKIHYAEN